jgi:hypothetical protein
MIPQKRCCPSAEQISFALLGMVALASAHAASADPLDPTQALDLITQTADRICNVVSTKGEAESADVKGQVQAQLSRLAAKLANVGVSGTGSINNEQYQNVLRQDLASTLHDNAECKLKVFQTLQVKLLPEIMPPPANNQPVEPRSNVQHNPIAWSDQLSFWTNGLLLGFVVRGNVTSPTPVQLTDAYVVSEITGERKFLKVEIAPGPKLAAISDINEIPPTALLQLWATFPSPGITGTDFLAHWGSFVFHAEYAGIKYDKVFSRDTVESFTRMQFPEVGPHVTPKELH